MRFRLALPAAALLAAAPAAAQDGAADEKLSVHGYLTQAYAASDSLQTMGITRDGTTDYRRAALLLRYAGSPKDNFVVQVAHRRLGDSPVMRFESDVKLDWGFYERRFGDATRLRVGKAPIPLGIYNETRYVGSVLPFYRAPYSFYFEGAFTSETVDGAVLSQTLWDGRPWSLSASAFGGNYRFVEFGGPAEDPAEFGVAQVKAQNAAGAQLWLSTPLTGVRLGAGASRATLKDGMLRAPGAKERQTGWNLGVDGSFDRAALRAEYRTFQYNVADYSGYYVQGGLQPVRGLWVNAQYEAIDLDLAAVPPSLPVEMSVRYNRDVSAGLAFTAGPTLLLKLEAHQARGYNYERPLDLLGARTRGRYVIASLSTAF